MGKQKEGGIELRERRKEGGERWSTERNRIFAQRENQVERWMDYTLGDDWTEAIDESESLCL